MANVYIIRNILNSKRYVGFTTLTVSERFKCHCDGRGGAVRLTRAIKKHGPMNFVIEQSIPLSTQEAAQDLERFLIESLDTIKKGYNLAEGGTGGNTTRGWSEVRRSEFARKMSNVTKGHKRWSADARKKLSASIKEAFSRRTNDQKKKQYDGIAESNRTFQSQLSKNPQEELQFRCDFIRTRKWMSLTNEEILQHFQVVRDLLDQKVAYREIARRVGLDRHVIKAIEIGSHWSSRHLPSNENSGASDPLVAA